ncbi:MAG: hypothetical protein H7X77_02420 [Anaerolineae bacterium]|nr:hypothetical protein [Anaerolineae bacterium]
MNIYISKRKLGMLFIILIWLVTVLIPVSLGHNRRINMDDAFSIILLLSPIAWFVIYQVMRRIEKMEPASEKWAGNYDHLREETSPDYESIEDLLAMPKRKNR